MNSNRLAAADDEFMHEALRVVYQQTNAGCPYQTFFTENEFIEENRQKLKLFLFDIDRSLGSLIKKQ